MDSRESTERTLLAGTFLFRGAPREAVELARTDPRALRRRAARGEVLYDPRHFQRSLGVVLEGRIQVNKGPLIMSVLGPGELFGAAALFNDRPDYATTLTARTNCRILFLPQEDVDRLLGEEPLLRRNYLRYLSGRIRFLSGRLGALAQTGAVAILSKEENKGKIAYFGGINSAKFKKKVVPGDKLRLECRIIKQKGPVGVGQAVATVDGKVAVSAELTFMVG